MNMFDAELRTQTQEPPAGSVAVVEIAIWAHTELVRIHPFQEGNGRTARLLMNVWIMRHITGPTRPLDIPEELRGRYVTAVQETRQGRPTAFEDLVAELLEDLARQGKSQKTRLEQLRLRRPRLRRQRRSR